jgi:hypothetical protein
MLETVLGDGSSRSRHYLAAKPSHMGVDVDGLACPLQRPVAYNRQTRGHGFLLGAALSHPVVVGGDAFPRDANPQAWIFDGVLTVWVPVLPTLYME